MTEEVIRFIVFGIGEKTPVPANCRFIRLKGE